MKVSILCTAFNHEKYISQALDSFLAQETDFDFEILVTDDASTDATPGILEEYAKEYPDKIRWFHQEENLFSKGGIGLIYESILYPESKGKYIAFCEGDDYWCNPGKLQRQVDFLDSHAEYSGCVHNSWYHYCDCNRNDELIIHAGDDKDLFFADIIGGLHKAFHTSSILARRDCIVNPPDFERVAADYGFLDYPWAINMSLNGKIRYFDEPMSVYRLNSIEESWRSGYDHSYSKKTRFVEGEIAMMKALIPHVSGEELELTKSELLRREYELAYLEGNVKQMVSEDYRHIFRSEPIPFKAKTLVKLMLPGLHQKYRRKQGYTK